MAARRRRSARRVLAVAAAVGAVVVATSTAQPAVADRGDARDGAAWLITPLVGESHYEPRGNPDYGLSIDTALALDAVREQDDTVRRIRDYIASEVSSYVGPFDLGGYTGTGSSEAAKTAVLALETGGDPRAFGGVDLVGLVEGVIDDDGPLVGRLSDDATFNGQPFADAVNTFGQSFAVHALSAVGSPEARPALRFLLAQQCSAGFFRLSFSKPTRADQSCDGAKQATGHVDATAMAVLQLQSVPGRKVDRAVTRAVAWLVKRQRADGSFVDTPGSSGPNTNSTGLAGWALGQERSTKAARAAARWLRDHQLVNVQGCAPFAATDLGAIAYNDAAFDAAVDGQPLDTEQFVRATAQALPALLSSPRGHEVDPCE